MHFYKIHAKTDVSFHKAKTNILSHDMTNQQNDCAHSEDSDQPGQPGHPPSLISLRCALNG